MRNLSKRLLCFFVCFLLASFGFVSLGSVRADDDTNLCPVNDGEWRSDVSWNLIPADNVYFDSSVTYGGAPTFRVDPGVSLGADHAEIYGVAGQHIVMSCWIRTTGYEISGEGAQLGFDVYGTKDGHWARIAGANDVESASAGQELGIYSNTVPFGHTDWIHIVWDWVMPTQYLSDGAPMMGGNPDYSFPAGQWEDVTGIFPWINANVYGNPILLTGSAWFSDFQLVVNPSGSSPTPSPYPSYSPQPTGTPAPHPNPSFPSVTPAPINSNPPSNSGNLSGIASAFGALMVIAMLSGVVESMTKTRKNS